MDLEHILRQKAAAKEARQIRQQEEEAAKTAEAERLKKQEAEESRLTGLRLSIAIIDTKIEQMQSLLTKLKQNHEQAKTSVAGVKKEGQELTRATAEVNKLFTNDEFRGILAEEGITSLDDLLTAKEYSEEEQIKSVKNLRQSKTEKRQTAREQVGIRRDTKTKAREAIAAEKPDAPKKLTYKDVTVALEEIIKDLGQEKKKLFYQTPEGQEALKAEILDRVKKRHKRSDYPSRLTSKNEINNAHMAGKEDVKDAAEYGEVEVKIALKDYFGKAIDADLADQGKRKGETQLREAVDVIENLPRLWEKIEVDLRKLQQANNETVKQLSRLLETDKDALGKFANYLQLFEKNPGAVAQRFVDFRSSLNNSSLGLGFSDEAPEAVLGRIVEKQVKLAEQTHRGNFRESFSRTDVSDEHHQYRTALENPERIEIILAELEEFYKKFRALIASPEQLFNELRPQGGDKMLDVKSQYDLGISDRGPVESHIKFDGKTYASLRDGRLSDIKAGLELQRKELEKISTVLKEQAADKIELDWALSEIYSFHDDKESYRLVRNAEKIAKMQKAAEGLSPRLGLATAQLQDQMNETVSFTNERLSFDSAPQSDLRRLQKEINKIQDEIHEIDSKIQGIDWRAGQEGDGLLGRKKKQRDQEKSQLEMKKQPLQQRLQNLQTEYQTKNDKDIKLGDVRHLLSTARRDGLELDIPSGSVSIKELIDDIKGQMNFELTPEQSRVYGQYRELEKKEKQARKQYEKWR